MANKPNNSVRHVGKKATPASFSGYGIKSQKTDNKSAVTKGNPPRRVAGTVKGKLKSGW
jgi:hypothetical protein